MIKHSAETNSSFDGLGIAPKLLEVLDRSNLKTPTPIQARCIPIALEGKDMMGIAQTGTGKTLAFGIPLLQRLAQTGGQGLVILPTRELAIQVDEVLHKIGRTIGLRTAVLIGGMPMPRQLAALRKNPHIIIASPGRLIDHLDQKNVSLDRIKILVLDEADRMFDMGFAPQIQKIIKAVPKERQTLLFSATMPTEILKLASVHLKLPVSIEVSRPGSASEKITHELFVVSRNDKIRLLEGLLGEYRGTILVFSRTKHGATKIVRDIRHMGQAAAELHSGRSLPQRREALDGFKSGRYRVLVATDIAARGIDVTGIEVVINFDLPDQAEDYVHRAGRTGRAGHTGHAISFVTPDQGDLVRNIEKLIRSPLPISKLPTLPATRARPAPTHEVRSSAPFQPKFGHRPKKSFRRKKY
jgi:ATP-dependent RNA helicase RhlE